MTPKSPGGRGEYKGTTGARPKRRAKFSVLPVDEANWEGGEGGRQQHGSRYTTARRNQTRGSEVELSEERSE